jgi:hypothetical protein
MVTAATADASIPDAASLRRFYIYKESGASHAPIKEHFLRMRALGWVDERFKRRASLNRSRLS